MSRQAHMELVMLNNYPAGLGETIYYVNNGKKKTSGDVQKITKPTKKQNEEFINTYGTPMPNGYIEINCYRISEKDIVNNPNNGITITSTDTGVLDKNRTKYTTSQQSDSNQKNK